MKYLDLLCLCNGAIDSSYIAPGMKCSSKTVAA